MKVIAVDFDGTITNGGYNDDLHPNKRTIEMLTIMHDSESPPHIVIYTARPESHRAFLRSWLHNNAVPYDSLVCGKLRADVYIDDKAVHVSDMERCVLNPHNNLSGGKSR